MLGNGVYGRVGVGGEWFKTNVVYGLGVKRVVLLGGCRRKDIWNE